VKPGCALSVSAKTKGGDGRLFGALTKGLVGTETASRTPTSGFRRAATLPEGQSDKVELRRKHKLRSTGQTRYPDSYLYEELGLLRLSGRTRSFP